MIKDVALPSTLFGIWHKSVDLWTGKIRKDVLLADAVSLVSRQKKVNGD